MDAAASSVHRIHRTSTGPTARPVSLPPCLKPIDEEPDLDHDDDDDDDETPSSTVINHLITDTTQPPCFEISSPNSSFHYGIIMPSPCSRGHQAMLLSVRPSICLSRSLCAHCRFKRIDRGQHGRLGLYREADCFSARYFVCFIIYYCTKMYNINSSTCIL